MLPHCAQDLRLHLVEPAELRIGASTTVQQVQDHPIGVDVLHPRTAAHLVGHPELAGSLWPVEHYHGGQQPHQTSIPRRRIPDSRQSRMFAVPDAAS